MLKTQQSEEVQDEESAIDPLSDLSIQPLTSAPSDCFHLQSEHKTGILWQWMEDLKHFCTTAFRSFLYFQVQLNLPATYQDQYQCQFQSQYQYKYKTNTNDTYWKLIQELRVRRKGWLSPALSTSLLGSECCPSHRMATCWSLLFRLNRREWGYDFLNRIDTAAKLCNLLQQDHICCLCE